MSCVTATVYLGLLQDTRYCVLAVVCFLNCLTCSCCPHNDPQTDLKLGPAHIGLLRPRSICLGLCGTSRCDKNGVCRIHGLSHDGYLFIGTGWLSRSYTVSMAHLMLGKKIIN